MDSMGTERERKSRLVSERRLSPLIPNFRLGTNQRLFATGSVEIVCRHKCSKDWFRSPVNRADIKTPAAPETGSYAGCYLHPDPPPGVQ
jgi:hypothetical protein